MTRGAILSSAAAICALVVGVTTPAEAQDPGTRPASARLWSNASALTIPEGRVEVGLFHPVRWGVTDDVELALHPVLEIALPHIEGKVRWLHRDAVSISSWHRLSYPTLFLQAVSREGTLGLLPANTDVPVAIALDTSFLVTVSSPDDNTHYTLELGLSVAPRFGGGDDVVLDFPFLYSRFAAVSTQGSTFAGLAVTTEISDNLSFSADLRLTQVPVIAHGFVLEHSATLAWYPSTSFGLLVGYRVAHGRYPVGVRTHVMPTVDVVLAF